jgi:hypothetical protein
LKFAKCYEVLGLPPGAGLKQIHRAFKRLAMQYHPDRNAGDSTKLQRFYEITEAYGVLRATLGSSKATHRMGQCHRCEKAAELFRGLNGQRYCTACLLPGRRKFLPLPKFITMECLSVLVFQGCAIYFILASISLGSWPHGLAGLVLGILSMVAMVFNVFEADVIEQ